MPSNIWGSAIAFRLASGRLAAAQNEAPDACHAKLQLVTDKKLDLKRGESEDRDAL
jgi:hypothetical protein